MQWKRLTFLILLGLGACRSRERVESVGDRGGVQGGGFTRNVSLYFRRPELEALYQWAVSDSARAALSEFTCGDPAPQMRYELRLRPAGEYNERLVYVGYAPDLDSSRRDRCLTKGIGYLFDEALSQIDFGPPIDYGYKNPHTGEPYGPGPRIVPRQPICRCDLRESGREWVEYSQRAAAELR